MDDLYGNLDNYNEERTIAELRRENQDLKLQLEKYSSSLDNLQKEFDKLTTEHNKLEVNYSSLLKTARAEIERKTAIIFQLNVEKDTLVLNSIQNKSTSHNYGKNVSKERHKTKEQIHEKSLPFGVEANRNKSIERKTDPHMVTANASSDIRTRYLDVSNNVKANANLNIDDIEAKENVRLKDEETKPRASIRNRRKSMPAFKVEGVLNNSDDEDNVTKKLISRKYSTNSHRDDIANSNSSSEDRLHSLPASRETHRSRQSKQSEGKSRERQDPSQRYKRNQSTDRNRNRSRDKSEENRQRQEYDRRRRKVTPPNEFQNHRSRALRSSNEKNRHQSRYQEQHAVKHKIIHEHEEPCTKRSRTDLTEEEKWRNDGQGSEIDRQEIMTDLRSLELERLRIERQLAPIDRHESRRDLHWQEEERLRNERLAPIVKRHELKRDLHRHEEDRLRNERCDAPIERKELIMDSHRHEEDRLRNERQSTMVGRHELRRRQEEERLRNQRHGAPIERIDMKIDSHRHQEERFKDERHDFKQDFRNEVGKLTKDGERAIERNECGKYIYRHEEEKFKNERHRKHFQGNEIRRDEYDEAILRNEQQVTPIERRETTTDSHKTEEERRRMERQEVLGERRELLQDMTCQSPDYIHLDAHHSSQTKEIKLNSTTKLEDPRISSKKYIFKTRDGKSELFTVESTQSDIKKIDTSGWDIIKQVKMPDALMQRPSSNVNSPCDRSSTDENKTETSDWDMIEKVNMPHLSQNRTCMTALPTDQNLNSPNELDTADSATPDKENSDSALEYTDDVIKNIYDDMDIMTVESKENNDLKEVQSHKIIIEHIKESSHGPPMSLTSEKKTELCSHKLGDYKIPKKSDKLIKNVRSCAQENISDVLTQTSEPLDKNPCVNNKVQLHPHFERSYIEQCENHDTGKDLMEDDLKLSDENSDLMESQNTNSTYLYGKQNIRENKLTITKVPGQRIIAIDGKGKYGDGIALEDNKSVNENIKIEGRSHKAKKKTLKLKTTKEPTENTKIEQIPVIVKKKDTKTQIRKLNTHSPVVKKPTKNKNLELVEVIDTDIASIKKRPVKKKEKESKISDAVEKTNTASSMDKSVKKIESKSKDIIESIVATPRSDKTDKKLKMIVTPETTAPETEQTNSKEKSTRFIELFGETTSSLISPEDLGLAPIISTKQTSHNNLPIFEDAQDAIDLDAVRIANVSKLIENAENNAAQHEPKLNIVSVNTNLPEPDTEDNAVGTASAEIMFQNMQPGNLTDNEIVKTVIISTGTQPKNSGLSMFGNVNNSEADLHVMQCVKPILTQNILQALATSTPLKYLQQNAIAGEKDTNPISDSIGSRDSDKVIAKDHSDQNTMDSQINGYDEPDVRIILKRKRRKIKK